jgi:cobalamin biosynthesis Co2+ chelatase CbiK
VQKDGEKFTINHLQDAEYQDVIGYTQHLIGPNNESTVRVINTLNRDNEKMGHVMDYKDYLVNFTPLLNYIRDLEQRIADLEDVISNLQAS